MKTKVLVAILLLMIFALSLVAMVPIRPAKAIGACTLSDAEMMSTDFIKENWSGTPSMTKTDVAGPGVQFDLTGLGKAGIFDKYELNPLAGGGGGAGGHYADFTGYNAYRVLFVNLGSSSFNVAIFMNTGFLPPDWRDSFWQSSWITIGPHESQTLTLDFSSSYQAWGISDDLDYPGHSNGEMGLPIWRLTEVTGIGFQVEGSGGATAASFLASGTLTHLYIDPPVVNKIPTDVGTTFNVNVMIANFTNFAGFDIKLTWDSSLITEIAEDYTTTLNALWGFPDKWSPVFEENLVGSYRLAVAALNTSASNSGASTLFTVAFQVDRRSNFPLATSIHFSVSDLSDNTEPFPNPIPATVTDGVYNMGAETPDLEFAVRDLTPSKPFEYGKIFEIEVNATHISATLKDYNITILYDPEFLICTTVNRWGVLGDNVTGQAQYIIASGSIRVWDTGGSDTYTGDNGFLFALRLKIVFDDRIEHIYRKNTPQTLTANIQFGDAQLSFLEGSPIPMSGINTPNSPQVVTIYLIRGDVNCDGKVDVSGDINAVAYYYGQNAPPAPEKYDLTQDGIINIYDLVTIATNYGYNI